MGEQYRIGRSTVSRKRARFITALLIIAVAAVGIVVVARGLKSRQARIEEAQEQIAALLDELDPLARVQVADYVIERERDKYRRSNDG